MLKQHFKVVVASAGLIGMAWLCGCKSAGTQCCRHCEHVDVTLAAPADQVPMADDSAGREPATPPVAHKEMPYDEPVVEVPPNNDRRTAAAPETESGTQVDPQPKNTTPRDTTKEPAKAPQDRLAALRELGSVIELNRDGDVVVVDLSVAKAGDSDLRLLKDLTKLEQLNLRGSQVTDAGLEQLKVLAALKLLDLGKTNVTDAGLVHLKQMTHLEYLLLGHTKITDAGLVHLQELTNLQGLSLIRTEITEEGVKKLRQSLPDCQIVAEIREKQDAASTPQHAAPVPQDPAPAPQHATPVPQDPAPAPQHAPPAPQDPAPAPQHATPAPEDAQQPATEEQNAPAAADDEVSDRQVSQVVDEIARLSRGDQSAKSTSVVVDASPNRLELQVNDPGLLGSVGEFYASGGRWSEAADVLSTALSASPDDDVLRYRLAVALARTGDVDGAMPHFVKSIGNAQAHYNLGVIVYEDALKASEHHFLEALRYNPNFDDARFWLAEIRRTRARMPRLDAPFRSRGTYDLLPLPLICPSPQPTDVRQARLR